MVDRGYTKEQYDEALELYDNGKHPKEISRLLNIDWEVIRSWVYRGSKPLDAWTEEELRKYNKTQSMRKWGKNNPNFGLKGSLSPKWKGNTVKYNSGRARARKLYYAPKGHHRHHIDGNPLNNDPENIMIVTPRKHMVEDGRMELLRRGLRDIKKGNV